MYIVLVERPEGIKPLGRPTRTWTDSTKMDFQDVGWGGMDWTDLARDGDMRNETSGSINCGVDPDKLRNCWLLKKDSVP